MSRVSVVYNSQKTDQGSAVFPIRRFQTELRMLREIVI